MLPRSDLSKVSVTSAHESLEVTGDEKRWILQGVLVKQQLVVGGLQVLVFSLVLPAKAALFPNVCKALTTTPFRCPPFEAERRADGIGPGRGWMAEDTT
jgi:hypothetical protein